MWVTLSPRCSCLTECIRFYESRLRRWDITGVLSWRKLWLQTQDHFKRCIGCSFDQWRLPWVDCYNVGWVLQGIFLLYRCLLGIKTLLQWGLQVVHIRLLLDCTLLGVIFFGRIANRRWGFFVRLFSFFLTVMRESLYFFVLRLILFHACAEAILIVILGGFCLPHGITYSFIIFSLRKIFNQRENG